jgi:hypothetical protein
LERTQLGRERKDFGLQVVPLAHQAGFLVGQLEDLGIKSAFKILPSLPNSSPAVRFLPGALKLFQVGG